MVAFFMACRCESWRVALTHCNTVVQGAMLGLLEMALSPVGDSLCDEMIEKAAAVGIMYLSTAV